MKIHNLTLRAFNYGMLLFLVCFLSSSTPVNNNQRDSILMEIFNGVIDRAHYNPHNINDEFSGKAFDLYLERLDNNKRFLLKQDVKKLKRYRSKLDDAFKQRSMEFFELSEKLINRRIDEVNDFYKDILEQSFDFTKSEKVFLDSEDRDYARNKEELRETWRKFLKYRTLVKLDQLMDRREKQKDSLPEEEVPSTDSLKEKAQQKVLESQENWFGRMQKIKRSDRISHYFNTLLNIHDPHTTYYPPKDKEDFDISMSGQLEGIGATLRKKNGYIEVVRIIPGSASWRQGELKSGHKIIKVAQPGEQPVDVMDMRLDEVVQLIRGKKGTKVILTVKTLDGSIKKITIVRDVVVIKDTYARSAVLKHDDKIGYIKLPKFYADLEDKDARRSARDIKKEVKKLKDNGVNGLVLDLRNNGGGSLRDVVDIAGYFIDKGPVVKIKAKNGRSRVLKDEDAGTLFDKPLVILVNTHSASASEIMAAAMKDYNRAVIMGTSTFGKGTVQRMYNLDRYVQGEDLDRKLGALKVTVQKFYGIDGRSTQLKGVSPHVVLPDEYMFLETGEQQQKHPLPWDKTEPSDFKTWKDSTAFKQAVRKSRKRVEKHETFTNIKQKARLLEERRNDKSYSLNLEKYRAFREKQEEKSEKFNNLMQPIEAMEVNALQAQKEVMKTDTTEKARIEDFHEKVKKDLYIFEAARVVEDLEGK